MNFFSDNTDNETKKTITNRFFIQNFQGFEGFFITSTHFMFFKADSKFYRFFPVNINVSSYISIPKMKPIISVISIFLSLGTAQAATIFPTTNTNTANNAGNNHFGSATQSSSSVMSAATNRKEATLPETVYLNSLSPDMHSGCRTGTYKNNTLNSWEGMYLSAVNFSTSNEVVPEPATATLGLFGLSTLLLRHRR
ncbi:PEP-CTERM sorting domain-containing protein [Akkermansia muciniphila]|jgi:hypothetical protein|uniref:PEP-CTERM sorting domain-containing protein n=2 Tax=Akkermansia muciniphila TaxID=239935 RepID=UPI0011AF4C6D|nr:PEP-CTERM sorting domain-containing protein [Akkermansia muciniphila]MBS6358531.1 PEP-CTERM sorting domain-containing protein [Akkermansia muciniphila]MCL6680840.1 PEP-CTERM sorting domain-containing protein [Akkermansia muciniphila]QIA36117.1 PEP-CTERM sorting domain-containing protein [Akkermansia muciniphila]QWO82746.1 PEP-CTERM sorting domain-containing protein [Akkermansia muciniphila]UBU78439.1 PEP-CTERM sorting domain-containing protein [Akkermansia muciniphila]